MRVWPYRENERKRPCDIIKKKRSRGVCEQTRQRETTPADVHVKIYICRIIYVTMVRRVHQCSHYVYIIYVQFTGVVKTCGLTAANDNDDPTSLLHTVPHFHSFEAHSTKLYRLYLVSVEMNLYTHTVL